MKPLPLDLHASLPHRGPMLLIDDILAVVPGQEASAMRTVQADDPLLVADGTRGAIFPDVLLVEAMAQTACVLATHSSDTPDVERLPMLVGVDSARFHSPVRAGDCMTLHVRCTRTWGPFWRLSAHAQIGERTVAEARLTATMVETARIPAPTSPRHRVSSAHSALEPVTGACNE